MRKLIYLGSPHSDPNPTIREIRYQWAMKALALLTVQDEAIVFSPIVHSHELAKIHSLPKEFGFWRGLDFAWLERCDEMWVLCIDGWEMSVGVKAEINFTKNLGKPIKFLAFTDGILQELSELEVMSAFRLLSTL